MHGLNFQIELFVDFKSVWTFCNSFQNCVLPSPASELSNQLKDKNKIV